MKAKASTSSSSPTAARMSPMADAASRMPALLQLELLGGARRLGGHHHLGQLRGEPGADGEHDGGQAHRELRAEGVAAELQQDAARDGGRRRRRRR